MANTPNSLPPEGPGACYVLCLENFPLVFHHLVPQVSSERTSPAFWVGQVYPYSNSAVLIPFLVLRAAWGQSWTVVMVFPSPSFMPAGLCSVLFTVVALRPGQRLAPCRPPSASAK